MAMAVCGGGGAGGGADAGGSGGGGAGGAVAVAVADVDVGAVAILDPSVLAVATLMLRLSYDDTPVGWMCVATQNVCLSCFLCYACDMIWT